MKNELLDIVTADNVGIHGALWEPETPGRTNGVDAWLLLPGSHGTFYSDNQRPIAYGLADAGYPALTLNTRGHSVAWTNRRDGRLMGGAAEIISDSVHDVRAALDALEARGYARLGLLGNSLGGIRSYYYLATQNDPRVKAFAAFSAPRSCRSTWEVGKHAARIAEGLALARQLVEEGKGDDLVRLPTGATSAYRTPRSYVDRYIDDRYDTFALAPKVSVPLIALRGSEEPDIMPDGYLEEILERAVNANPRRSFTVQGAGHSYQDGTHLLGVDAVVEFMAGVASR